MAEQVVLKRGSGSWRWHEGGQAMVWWPGPASLPDGPETAYFTCPHGHLGSLAGHQIDESGRVSPSVLLGPCGWHVFATLEGWATRKEPAWPTD